MDITVTKDKKVRCSIIFNPILEKTMKKLNQQLQRYLSLKGRILLLKAEGISRLIYAAISLGVDNNICKDIDKMLYLEKQNTLY